jgi:hypothetical protein
MIRPFIGASVRIAGPLHVGAYWRPSRRRTARIGDVRHVVPREDDGMIRVWVPSAHAWFIVLAFGFVLFAMFAL